MQGIVSRLSIVSCCKQSKAMKVIMCLAIKNKSINNNDDDDDDDDNDTK